MGKIQNREAQLAGDRGGKSYVGHEHGRMLEVLEVLALMPQPHHRQHSGFLSMAMDLAHVGRVAGEASGLHSSQSWLRSMTTFAQI
jgi:hypothetical protein